MVRSDDLYQLPDDIPVPVDDGACAHLPGMRVPALELRSTGGRGVRIDQESVARRVVAYCYPRTGTPDHDPPAGWNQIPGARGCTPQSCGFRDLHADFSARHVTVFGLSTQTSEYQLEMAIRLGLPFEILSDADLRLTRALRLPTFELMGMTLLKRHTLVIRSGVIEKVFYPVFPPDLNASEVLAWLDLQGA